MADPRVLRPAPCNCNHCVALSPALRDRQRDADTRALHRLHYGVAAVALPAAKAPAVQPPGHEAPPSPAWSDGGGGGGGWPSEEEDDIYAEPPPEEASDADVDAAADGLADLDAAGMGQAASVGLSTLGAAGVFAQPTVATQDGRLPFGGDAVARERKLKKVFENSPEIFPGCTVLVLLLAIVAIKVSSNWSDASVEKLLLLQKRLLRGMGKSAAADALPGSWDAARRRLAPLCPEQREYHGCSICGYIYTGVETVCPGLDGKCCKPRYTFTRSGEKVPAFIALRTIDLATQYHLLSRRKEIAALLADHVKRRRDDGLMVDIADTPDWAAQEEAFPCLKAEPRHLRVALSTDGVCAHSLCLFWLRLSAASHTPASPPPQLCLPVPEHVLQHVLRARAAELTRPRAAQARLLDSVGHHRGREVPQGHAGRAARAGCRPYARLDGRCGAVHWRQRVRDAARYAYARLRGRPGCGKDVGTLRAWWRVRLPAMPQAVRPPGRAAALGRGTRLSIPDLVPSYPVDPRPPAAQDCQVCGRGDRLHREGDGCGFQGRAQGAQRHPRPLCVR